MSHRTRHRPSSPSAMGIICLVAGLGLVAVMGVAIIRDQKAPLPDAPAKVPFIRAHVAPQPQRPARIQKADDPITALKRRISAAEKSMPQIKRNERGRGFEEARVALLAQISEVRDELGLYLDSHPSDTSANRLWDRTMRLYVALRKL